MTYCLDLTSWQFTATIQKTMGGNNTFVSRLLWGLNELIHGKYLEQCLAHRVCLGISIAINVWHIPDTKHK